MRTHRSLLLLLAIFAPVALLRAQDSTVVRLAPHDGGDFYADIADAAFAGADSRTIQRIGGVPFVRWRLLVVRDAIEPTLVLERFVGPRRGQHGNTRLDVWTLPLVEALRALRLPTAEWDIRDIVALENSTFAVRLDFHSLSVAVRHDTTAVVTLQRTTAK